LGLLNAVNSVLTPVATAGATSIAVENSGISISPL
jgi:hypothetical protein